MKKIIALAFSMLSLAVVALPDVEDAQLRHVLERAVRYEDNPRAARAEVCYAITLSGGDTNRVVSLLKLLINEGPERDGITGFYLSEIGKHGTAADLPFLYPWVETSRFCEVATEAILKIEGLTTNSLVQVTSSLPNGQSGAWGTVCSRVRLLRAARELPSGSQLRTLAVSNAIAFAARETEYPSSFDKSIRLTDPTYTTSKRRLAVLRSVRDLGVNEWQTNFVTRTIRELEAYPEANLPE